MVSDVGSLGFVSADDGYIVESALLSSFIDNRAAAASKLLIQDEVLHPLWKRHKRPELLLLLLKLLIS